MDVQIIFDNDTPKLKTWYVDTRNKTHLVKIEKDEGKNMFFADIVKLEANAEIVRTEQFRTLGNLLYSYSWLDECKCYLAHVDDVYLEIGNDRELELNILQGGETKHY